MKLRGCEFRFLVVGVCIPFYVTTWLANNRIGTFPERECSINDHSSARSGRMEPLTHHGLRELGIKGVDLAVAISFGFLT